MKGKGITYEATEENIKLMRQGKAPIGLDEKPVELHHIKGREFEDIVQMQQTVHRGAKDILSCNRGI